MAMEREMYDGLYTHFIVDIVQNTAIQLPFMEDTPSCLEYPCIFLLYVHSVRNKTVMISWMHGLVSFTSTCTFGRSEDPGDWERSSVSQK